MPEQKSFEIAGGHSLEMVHIEPGTFQMGSPEAEIGRWPDEGPVHSVTISKAFHLGRAAVTQSVWEAIMGTRPWSGKDYVREDADSPATYVSWEDAGAFLAALNEKESGEPYRLPTEAEWEYACRAGTASSLSFGDDTAQLRKFAWFKENAWDVGEQYAHRVGQKQPNPWELSDMHGNVWEWCQDLYGAYGAEAQTDPQGGEKGDARVLRGSGFASDARALRSAFRYSFSSGRQFHCVGFRPLRAAD